MLGKLCYFVAAFVALTNGNEWAKEFKVAEIASLNAPRLFELWAKDLNKTYQNVEEQLHRFQIFVDNLDRISKHNSDETKTFKMKLNQFGDQTAEEFTEYMELSGMKKVKKTRINPGKRSLTDVSGNPSSVDWQAKGYVTPVKNQGQCGSCWSFATTGAVECAYAQRWGTEYLIPLSEQQLVDCTYYGSYGNYGCGGGFPDKAFQYVINNGGLCQEATYPYLGYYSGSCKSTSCGYSYGTISSYKDITYDNEGALETAVSKGCVAILIEADGSTFQFYSSGIYYDACYTYTDHAVLAVGYGTDPSTGGSYWKVKNSWGTYWGMEGYINICKNCGANGAAGQCGINTGPSMPVISY